MNANAETVADESDSRELAPSATDQALLQAITKAEIDQAIVAAHARPRSVALFRKECRDLVCLDKETADECIYALPRREKDKATGKWVTKFIEGPSARMAEIVVYCWRNTRAGARVTDEGREFVTAQGVFQDLERNTYITYEVRRRITDRENRRYSADMIQVTGNAACSIALRNAVFKGVPKALWASIYDAAQKVCAGDARTLVARRQEALEALTKLHVTPEMACATMGVAGQEDLTAEHIATLRGLHNAVRDGEMSIEEAFAPKEEAQQMGASRADVAKDALRKGPASAAKEDSKTAQQQQSGAEAPIPHFDKGSALSELQKATTAKALDASYKTVRKDFKDTNRELPVDVEAYYNDRIESFRQKGDQLEL